MGLREARAGTDLSFFEPRFELVAELSIGQLRDIDVGEVSH